MADALRVFADALRKIEMPTGRQVTEEGVAEWTDYHRGGRIGLWGWDGRLAQRQSK